MNHKLSIDEFDALEQVSQLGKHGKPSVCVNRNAKKLSGIKLIAFRKDGSLELTEIGRQTLFIKQCIDGLRAIAKGEEVKLPNAIVNFLSKKAHVQLNPDTQQLEITQRGRECLEDIEQQQAG